MIYKSCSRCGKMHPKGYTCNVGRVYRGGDERKLRASNAWKTKSLNIRDRSSYLCAVCRDLGIFTYEGVEVHHIIKIKDDKDLLLEDTNLICLCPEHHKQADSGKLSVEYLKKLADARDM